MTGSPTPRVSQKRVEKRWPVPIGQLDAPENGMFFSLEVGERSDADPGAVNELDGAALS